MGAYCTDIDECQNECDYGWQVYKVHKRATCFLDFGQWSVDSAARICFNNSASLPSPADYHENFAIGSFYNITDGKYNYSSGYIEIALNGYYDTSYRQWRTFTNDSSLGEKIPFSKWDNGYPRNLPTWRDYYKAQSSLCSQEFSNNDLRRFDWSNSLLLNPTINFGEHLTRFTWY